MPKRTKPQLTESQIKKRLLTKGEHHMADVVERLQAFHKHKISPVLITGSSGTGKEFVARLLLDAETLGDKYQAENCAGIAEDLVYSELFGNEKGAFTGASVARTGVIRSGCQSLFLDEIDKSSPSLQNALLRFLRTGEVRPVGNDKAVKVDKQIRLAFAASVPSKVLLSPVHKKLEEAATIYRGPESGSDSSASNSSAERRPASDRILSVMTDQDLDVSDEMSRDFLNRLAGAVIDMPVLALRRPDYSLFASKFIESHCKELGLDIKSVEGPWIYFLFTYHWPYNIPEFESFIRHSLIFSRYKTLRLADGLQLFGSETSRLLEIMDSLPKPPFADDLIRNYLGVESNKFVDLIGYECPRCALFSRKNLARICDNIVWLSEPSHTGECDVFDLDKVMKYFRLRTQFSTKIQIYKELGFKNLQAFNEWLRKHHLFG